MRLGSVVGATCVRSERAGDSNQGLNNRDLIADDSAGEYLQPLMSRPAQRVLLNLVDRHMIFIVREPQCEIGPFRPGSGDISAEKRLHQAQPKAIVHCGISDCIQSRFALIGIQFGDQLRRPTRRLEICGELVGPTHWTGQPAGDLAGSLLIDIGNGERHFAGAPKSCKSIPSGCIKRTTEGDRLPNTIRKLRAINRSGLLK